MAKRCLVTGGAGFIGSHIVDELVRAGHRVTVLDSLTPQVHHGGTVPEYLNKEVEFIKGDVRDYQALRSAVLSNEVIFHKAGAVGVGQSQYEIKHYIDVNEGGTANLLDIVVNNKHSIEKIVVAASMSSYGEGNYLCGSCGTVRPPLRIKEVSGAWDPLCPKCSGKITAQPTDEDAVQYCNSIYSLSKKNQEDMCHIIGKTYDIPTVALRYFNVYGPRQSLSNPYTGVAAIFMSRIKNGNQPVIYEDGKQSRDFVSVYDIVKANMLAMEKEEANYQTFNIGSGEALEIKKIAEILAELYGSDIRPDITHGFRKGDVRHCYADIKKAKKYIGFEPSVSFYQGMRELTEWSKCAFSEDNFNLAYMELANKGIV